MMIIVRWKVLSWKDKPQGELNIHQLRDNIHRHQFVERDGTIWIGIRAAMRGVFPWGGRVGSLEMDLWVGTPIAVMYLFFNGSWESF
jgi:hypothetical protein